MKEGWESKNWCFQIVVLEKILGSPLDSKEIKLVNTNGNQLWIFIGRTDAEASILWPPYAKNWLIGKDPDAGKIEDRRRRKWQIMRCLGGIIDSTDTSLRKLGEIVKDREAWHAAVHAVTKSQTQLSDWTTTICKILSVFPLKGSHGMLKMNKQTNKIKGEIWDPVNEEFNTEQRKW